MKIYVNGQLSHSQQPTPLPQLGVANLTIADEPADAFIEPVENNGAAELSARAQWACEILAEASDDHEGSDLGSAAVREALNSLIDLAPHFPDRHIDKFLVGFLQDCIFNDRERYLRDFVETIVDSRARHLGAGHMMALLCGRATPVAPDDWKPGIAPVSPTIVNLQGAQLAADQYRGMPPLLHRMLMRTVAPADRRMDQGIQCFLRAVLNSNSLSDAEKAVVWLSAYGAARKTKETDPQTNTEATQRVASVHTLAQTAMLKGHIGALAAIFEALIRSQVEWPVKWDFIALQGLGLREVVDGLRAVAGLPHHEWTKDAVASMEPLARWQALQLAEGHATMGAPGTELDQLCASAELQAEGMQTDNGHLKVCCWSVSPISALSKYKLESPPAGAPSRGDATWWYSIPWRLVRPRM